MLNVIFVLHCSGHSGRATEIVHITECAHRWHKAANGLISMIVKDLFKLPPSLKFLFKLSGSVIQDDPQDPACECRICRQRRKIWLLEVSWILFVVCL